MTTAPVVLMLTDGLTLEDVRTLTTGHDGPDLFHCSVYSSSRTTPQGIVGTEAQLTRLRDVIDQAVGRCRDIQRQRRLVSMAPVDIAQRALDNARTELAAAFGHDPGNPPPLTDLLDQLTTESTGS